MLRNRIYIGEVSHKSQRYKGEQEPLLDQALFDSVQAQLAENSQTKRRAPEKSGALLTGNIFDDRGNLMAPSYSVRRGLRYRYYVSRACVEGRKNEKGTVHRVPAYEVEHEIVGALRTTDCIDTSGTDIDALIAMVISLHMRMVSPPIS